MLLSFKLGLRHINKRKPTNSMFDSKWELKFDNILFKPKRSVMFHSIQKGNGCLISDAVHMSNGYIFSVFQQTLCLFNHCRLLVRSAQDQNEWCSTSHFSTASNYWHQFTCGARIQSAFQCIRWICENFCCFFSLLFVYV